ncbi:MAG: DUF2828 family protein [Synergistaceae bacterium]
MPLFDSRIDIVEQIEDMQEELPTPLPNSKGKKGDPVYRHSLSPLVEFFSKGGNLSSKRRSYYGNTVSSLDLFKHAWECSQYPSMQLAMWMRDCRGGAGNRNGFREVIRWIAENSPSWITANIHLIIEVGRWDDLIALIGTPCEEIALKYWADAILDKNGLACKWTPREKSNKEVYHKIRKTLRFSPPKFRKLISEYTDVVETKMCEQKWGEINYNHVPSVAMARLTNAFSARDYERFCIWKESLSDPNSKNKINASVLFPHDCIRTLRAELGNKFNGGCYHWSYDRNNGEEVYEDSLIANAQFEALPNFMEENEMRIMPICDFSGSMVTPISEGNTIQLIDICMGLGLYCSDRVGKDNPFYRKFIPFSNDSRLVSWKDDTFSVAVQKHNDGFCGITNIRSALDQILSAGELFGATNDQMPNCLLIFSDMQWDSQIQGGGTAVEQGMKAWEEKGYTRPRIVYWNLNKYDGQPSTINHKDVALVSGYSPSLLRAICSGEDFTPMGIMFKTIAKYEVIDPDKP